MDDINTDRRIAEFRRSLLNYEDMAAQNRTSENRSSDPDSGYRTSTPEPSAFIANPESPHLPDSPALHPNITTRARNRNHRRFSDLFSLSHRGRHNNTPTFDNDRRPKISRPIVNQGDIGVPHNGPYIYNHPSRPRLDVEIPRSSFSDLWGQRYGPVGEDGYNIDARPSPRATRSMDFDRLVDSRNEHGTLIRRQALGLGWIGDWYANGIPEFVRPANTDGSVANSGRDEDGFAAEEEDDMDASYLMPLVSPSPGASSSSTTSASLPSISHLVRPPSTLIQREQEAHSVSRTPSPALEDEQVQESTPLVHELSERWIRHPLRQNPPTMPPPLPPAPPSSLVSLTAPPPPSPPSSSAVDTWSHLNGFRPNCGVMINSVGENGAVVYPFFVDPIVTPPDAMRGATPTPPHATAGTGMGATQHGSEIDGSESNPFVTSSSSTATPPHHRRTSTRSNETIKNFCCGLFGNKKKKNRNKARPSISAPIAQTPVFAPAAHATIIEEDTEEQLGGQENQASGSVVEQEEEADGGGEGGVRRRQSVRHSWVTVSRWLE